VTDRREPMVVYLVVVLAFSALFVAFWVFPTQPALPAVAPGCPGLSAPTRPLAQLTPSQPTLLAVNAQYPASSGCLVFSVAAAVDFHGAWSSTGPLGVFVLNSSTILPPKFCPFRGCGEANGTFNLSLFPGTYAVHFVRYGNASPERVVTVTQAFEATYDRGLEVLEPPNPGLSVTPNGYSAWPISVPAGASSFLVAGSISVSGCNYTVAILPQSVFQAFQSDRNAINSSGVHLIYSSIWRWCQAPPAPNNVTLEAFSFPLTLASGDTLVLWNQSRSTICIAVLAPIEVSYLLPT
jgi:hypothetical protein